MNERMDERMTNDERMTESERATLCRRIDELCAENERLRQENQSIGMAAYELGRKNMADENAKLRSMRDVWQENDANLREQCAKLRELVRDYEHCTIHADCSRCEYDGKLSAHCPFSPCFPDTGELYELGIEVGD